MTNIILGIFFSTYWEEIQQKTNSYSYFGWNEIPNYQRNYTMESIVEDCIKPLVEVIEGINFLLDGLYLPLNSEVSITCKELEYIISTPKALKMTQFWLKGEKIDTQAVLRIIKSVKDSTLTFDNLDLKTF